SVSGSVSLELLYRGKPSVMFYHVHPLTIWIARRSFALKSITLVNLLAKRQLFPDYVSPTGGGKSFDGDGPIDDPLEERLAAHALHWLEDRSAYEGLCGELEALRRQVVTPGACERAAAAVLGLARAGARAAA